jgi:Mg-chelatase subunit ChlD
MQGLFGRVRSQLKSSIASLAPDQYFNIIFFSDGRLLELSKGGLLRATEKAKLSAYDLADRVRPSGQTNASEGLVRAMSIRDNRGNSPQLIYFLTDGFDLNQISDKRFSFMVESQRKRLASNTRINTIGFWTQQSDRKILQRISSLSGGEYTEID